MTKNIIRRTILACLAGTMLLSFSACSKKPKQTDALTMNVPETEETVYTLQEPVDTAAWATAAPEEEVFLKLQDVTLMTGETFPLVILDTDSEPIEAPDELTSLSEDLVLNSTGVQLGDGTIEDLAENELYRWTENSGFKTVSYTEPVKVAENRYMTHLALQAEDAEGAKMEQTVFYTKVTEELARIDRLWRSVKEDDTGNAVFDAVSSQLLTFDTAVPLSEDLS